MSLQAMFTPQEQWAIAGDPGHRNHQEVVQMLAEYFGGASLAELEQLREAGYQAVWETAVKLKMARQELKLARQEARIRLLEAKWVADAVAGALFGHIADRRHSLLTGRCCP